ncbi:TPA: DUF551 domain-containing protein [Klebsiella quasipneumoniae]
MTKSTITRERLEWLSQISCRDDIEDIGGDEIRELARMALAAMDSEPVAIIDQANLDYLRSGADADVWPPEREEMGDVLLYRHPQPAPVVPDDGLIAELLTIAKEAADDADVFAYSEFNNKSMRHSTAIADWERRAAMLNQAQEPATYNTAPQPAVVSDEMIDTFEAEFRSAFKVSPEVKQMLEIGYHGEKFSLSIRDAAILWKLGRAAMLHAGNSPAQSDCCPAQNSVVPAQSGNSPAIPDGYVLVPKEATKEILDEFDSIIDYGAEDSVDAWHRLLAAATQEVKP